MTNLLWVLVCFTWSANTEPDLAGYRLYHGTQSGVYTNVTALSATNTRTCVNVAKGTTNYFVLTAFNASGTESLPTAELCFESPSVRLYVEASDDLSEWREVPGVFWPLPFGEVKRFYRVGVR
jgi:hypothetical protein